MPHDVLLRFRHGATVKRTSSVRNSNKIPNHYIVVLDDSVVGEKACVLHLSPYVADDLAVRHRGKVDARLSTRNQWLRSGNVEADAEDHGFKDFRVAYVEEDGVMTADTTQTIRPGDLTASTNATGP